MVAYLLFKAPVKSLEVLACLQGCQPYLSFAEFKLKWIGWDILVGQMSLGEKSFLTIPA